MADAETWLEGAREALAVATLAYFFAARLKRVKISDRTIWPFLVTFSFVAAATAVDLVASFRRCPEDEIPVAVNIYTFGIIFQLDGLWVHDAQPAWHAHVGCWVLMVVFETLSLVQYSLEATRATSPDLVGSLVAAGLKTLFLLGLAAQFARGCQWARRGYTAVPVDEETGSSSDTSGAPSGGSTNATLHEDGGEGPLKASSDGDTLLRELTEKEIKKAGGLWRWIRKFTIFWPWMWPHGRPRLQLQTVLTFLLVLLQVVLGLAEPRLQGAFINSAADSIRQSSMDPVWRPLLKYIAIFVVNSRLVISTLHDALWTDVTLERNLKRDQDIYGHVMNLGSTYHDSVDPTDTLTAIKLGEDITGAMDSLVFEVVPQLMSFAGAGAAVWVSYGPHVALVLAYVMVVHALNARHTFKTVAPKRDAARASSQVAQRRLHKGIRSWGTVARHNNVGQETAGYNDETLSLKTQERSVAVLSMAFRWLSNLFFYSGYWLATLLMMHRLVATGTGSVEDVVAFGAYWSLLLDPLLSIIDLPRKLIEKFYAAARLRRIMATEPAVKDGDGKLDESQREVVFDRVTLCLGGRTIFEDMSLTFPEGQTTAIVGESGLGKSTMLDLVIRMRELDGGAIKIGGTDIAHVSIKCLRSHVGIMPQVTNQNIFTGTIKDNVGYSKLGATDDEVREACRKARIHDDIMEREGGYESDATTLSGGQQQRLLWARIFLQDPPIVLLDEPTASLDGDNADAIMETARLVFLGKTVILVGHLMSSVMSADKIYVLKKGGAVAQSGTHEQLLAEDGRYANLWQKHLGKQVEIPVERIL
ncbi:ABC transporter [Pleurostoma richardsiae]|uniref:ABC transporter n=1 Tax=Pleurostoma richardsiae TaxID=41990 RepID=A0AA38R6U1_9PEZI|nr:ABC transporter [Pleurostoma richardsiae]